MKRRWVFKAMALVGVSAWFLVGGGLAVQSVHADEVYILNDTKLGVVHAETSAETDVPHGVYGRSYDKDGVRGVSDGGAYADNGVYGETNSTSASDAGVMGYSTTDAAGVYGFNYDSEEPTSVNHSVGVLAYSRKGHGVYSQGGSLSGDYGGYFRGANGIYAEGTGNGYGIYAKNSGSGWNAWRFEADDVTGVYAESKGGLYNGVHAQSAGQYGVYANTNVSGGYGFYTPDKIRTFGGCVGCTSMLICQNADSMTLEPGDVVAVVGIGKKPVESYVRPVLAVRLADAALAGSVVGVVEGRYETQEVVREHVRIETRLEERVIQTEGESKTEMVPVKAEIKEQVTMEDAHTTTEPAAPGEYLTVIYRGLAQVKTQALSSPIAVGDQLAAGVNPGKAVSAMYPVSRDAGQSSGFVLGKAVEAFSGGEGLVWTLVDLQ